MGTLTVTGRRRKEIHAVVRRRAATLFDPPGPPGLLDLPDSPSLPDAAGAPDLPARPDRRDPSPPEPRHPGPGREQPVPEPVRQRVATWLYVRCGIEGKTAAALAVILMAAVGFGLHHFVTGRPETVAVPPAARPALPPAAPDPGPGPPVPAGSGAKGAVVVHVAGKVRKPGVRRLPAGSRIADALDAAGGALPGTDTSALNLARVLGDGEQVLVGAPAPAGGVPGAGAPPVPVSLSTATLEQLDALPGVGPVLARHILDHRARYGGFTSVDQLQEVNGIGERRFADLKPLVRP